MKSPLPCLALIMVALLRPAPGFATVSATDLIGSWQSVVVDTSDPTYHFYDTLEVWFGEDGKVEWRSTESDVDLQYPEDSFQLAMQMNGTWKVEGSELVTVTQACRQWSSFIGPELCDSANLENDTTALADYSIQILDGHRALVYSPVDSGTVGDTLYYRGSAPAFTLQPVAGIMPPRVLPEARPRRNAKVLGLGSLLGSTGLMDMLGRARSGSKPNPGIFFTRP